jgi:hypothetical protein
LFCSPSGGVGTDTVDYSASSAGVTVNLTNTGAQSGGDAAGDILSNFENVVGSAHNDTITGDANTSALGSYGVDWTLSITSAAPGAWTAATLRRLKHLAFFPDRRIHKASFLSEQSRPPCGGHANSQVVSLRFSITSSVLIKSSSMPTIVHDRR